MKIDSREETVRRTVVARVHRPMKLRLMFNPRIQFTASHVRVETELEDGHDRVLVVYAWGPVVGDPGRVVTDHWFRLDDAPRWLRTVVLELLS